MAEQPAGRDPDSALDPYIGRVMGGKYNLEALVGAGAMGRVYRATQRPLERVVAVKILNAPIAADESARQRFLREARVASRFEHDGSVKVFDFGLEPDGSVYLVMEFIEGENLDDVIVREGPLPLDRIVSIALKVLSALAAAHDAGIVHRDLKPENILLVRRRDDDGAETEVVKVADFGIARIIGEGTDAARLTSTGVVSGTPAYMSPEQAQARPVDARSDLYSFGAVLYEMATGAIPFTADNAIAVIIKHINEPPPPPSKLLPSINPLLEGVILKLLAKNPDERFQDARSLRQALRGLTAAPSVSSPMPAISPTAVILPSEKISPPAHSQEAPTLSATLADSSPGTLPASRRKALAAFITASAIITVGVGVVTVVSPRRTRQTPTARAAEISPSSSPVAPVRTEAIPEHTTAAIAPVPPEVSPAPAIVPAPSEDSSTAEPPHRNDTRGESLPAHTRSRTRGRESTTETIAEHPVATPPTTPAPTPSVVAPLRPATVATAPSVAPTVPPTPSPQPPPRAVATETITAPPLRSVTGHLSDVAISGGVTRSSVSGRLDRARDALARCVFDHSAARMTASHSVTVTVTVVDRRAESVRLTGGDGVATGCESTVRSSFTGDLPEALDAEYDLRFSVRLDPQH